jgi:SAM-dependent methyltransferase
MERLTRYDNDDRVERLLHVEEQRENYFIARFEEATARYLDRLRDLDLRCAASVRFDEAIYSEIALLTDSMLEACARFEREAQDKDLIKAARLDFYRKTNPILAKSYCIERCRTWPQGGQGDYMTLELAYRNTPLSEGIGYYLDKYMLASSLGVGVRERIDMLARLLKAEIASRENPRILDIACGSCREIPEIVPEIKQSNAKLTCIDLDNDALNFALDRLSMFGIVPEHVDFLKYNALRLFDMDIAMAEFGPQEIIYSVGYFDYLPDEFLVKMLRTLYAMLKPGGTLIAAFKDADLYNQQLYHWLVDWDGFLQRRMDDFERLIGEAGIPGHARTVSRVEAGMIVFYSLEKQ